MLAMAAGSHNEKKRILILNYEHPPVGGGGGVAAHAFAQGFIKRGYEVDYVTSRIGEMLRYEVVEGVHVYRIRAFTRKHLHQASLMSTILFPFQAFFIASQLCRKYSYSFIHTHFVYPTGILGYIIGKIFSIKNILSVHGGDIYDPTKKFSPHRFWWSRSIARFIMNRADVLVAQSHNTKQNCISMYGIEKEVHVIPLPYQTIPFDPVSRSDLGLEKEKFYIVGCGRLNKRKGFDTFLRVIAALDKKFTGIIIGDGPEMSFLKTLASQMGIEDRVIFTGYLDGQHKMQYFDNADVFLLSSVHEGFGIVLQEAMQASLPIVAFDHGGQVDLIKQDVNGVLVPSGDTEGLVQAVLRLAEDKKYYMNMQGNSVEELEKFELMHVTDQFLKKVL